jgi:ribosomal protein L21
VIVQKDGSQLTVASGRSITMNDGTKVMGDGTVIRFNGDQTTVKEGQILALEGVVKLPR